MNIYKLLGWFTGDGALLVLIAGCIGAGAAVSYTATATHYKAKIAAIEADQAKREAAIATAVMETQQAQAQQITEALNVAQERTIAAQRDAVAATAANRSLRDALAAYRAKNASPACSGQSEQDPDPIGVLADLLGRMGEAGERISRYADEVKIAGAACEAARPTHANSESKL